MIASVKPWSHLQSASYNSRCNIRNARNGYQQKFKHAAYLTHNFYPIFKRFSNLIGRPGGRHFGHPLDRKHTFFKGGLILCGEQVASKNSNLLATRVMGFKLTGYRRRCEVVLGGGAGYGPRRHDHGLRRDNRHAGGQGDNGKRLHTRLHGWWWR